ncbi:unnamed protein product [Calicophoron daubneyi]|uniref:Troponin I n=1 Tax=Calicophoron daubneyi TaxID=300641 RepID=A0AAV2TK73_CALDB
MPVPNIMVLSDDEDEEQTAPKFPPKPLISLSKLVSGEDNESDETGSEDDDVMTAEEELAALRYTTRGVEPVRRMSSLDMYLAQPKETSESFVLSRRKSVKEELEVVEKLNAVDIAEQEEKARREKAEREREAVKQARQEKKETKKVAGTETKRRSYVKRGFGGLSREKRKKLKELIMQKAKAELKAERTKELQKREEYLRSVVPPLNLDDLNETQLKDLIQSWHAHARELENQKLDMEEKVRKQDHEIAELTMKLTDTRGKYTMPILRKVTKKENVLARLERIRTMNAMHVTNPAVSLKTILKPVSNPGEHEDTQKDGEESVRAE